MLFSNSRCIVHRKLNEWTGKVVVSWQRYCEKMRLQGTAVEREEFPDQKLEMSETERPASLLHRSMSEPTQNLFRNPESRSNLSSMVYPEMDEHNLIGGIYGMLEDMEMKIRNIKTLYSETSESSSGSGSLSTQQLLSNIKTLSEADEANTAVTTSRDLEQTILQLRHQITLLREGQLHQSRSERLLHQQHDSVSHFMNTVWEDDDSFENESAPQYKDDLTADSFNDNKSADSNCSSMTTSDLSRSQGTAKYQREESDTTVESHSHSSSEVTGKMRGSEKDHPTLSSPTPIIPPPLSSTLPLTLESLTMHKSKTELSLAPEEHILRSSTSVPVFTQHQQEQPLHHSFQKKGDFSRTDSYNYVIARVKSSDSLSSMCEEMDAAAVGSGKSSTEDKESDRLSSSGKGGKREEGEDEKEEKEDEEKEVEEEEESRKLVEMQRREEQRLRMKLEIDERHQNYRIKINMSELPPTTRGLMQLFNIASPTVFEGGEALLVLPSLLFCLISPRLLFDFRVGGEEVFH